MFWLALHGYVGTELATSAKQALKIKIHDNITKSYGGVPLRTIILLAICLAMIGSWGKYKNFVWTPCTFANSFSYFLSIMMCGLFLQAFSSMVKYQENSLLSSIQNVSSMRTICIS